MGLKETIAENVRAYRKIASLTQAQLAEKSGVHRTYIGAIEQRRSNPSLSSVEKITTALDIEPALLFVHRQDGQIIEIQDYVDGCMQPGGRDLRFVKGDFALCEFTGNGIELRPIRVYDEDIAIRLMCELMNSGHTTDLAEAYSDAIDNVMEAFTFRRSRLMDRKVRKFVEAMDKR